MLKFGKITNIDDKTCKVRVQLSDADDYVSDWLPFLVKKTKNDKDYIMPDIDEDVAVLFDEELESGIVLGAFYSSLNPVTNKDRNLYYYEFSDGTVFKYDRKNGKLDISVNGNIELEATNIMITAETINITADTMQIQSTTIHTGDLTVTGNIYSSGQVADAVSTMQTIRNIYNTHLNGAGTTTPTEQMR